MKKMNQSQILSEDQVKEMTKRLMENLPEGMGQYLAEMLIDPEETVRILSLSRKFAEKRIETEKSIKNLGQELKVPQYRIKAIEEGQVGAIKPTVLRKYSDYLGLNDWCLDWAAINEELAEKLGIPHWN